MLNKPITLKPGFGRQLHSYPAQRLALIGLVVLVLTSIQLVFKLGASGNVSLAPVVDSFTPFDKLLPGQQRDLVYSYLPVANQRTRNGQLIVETSASIVPESGPFHLIQVTYNEREIEAATFYTQKLCACELYQRWGEPDETTRQRGGQAYRLVWYEADYQVTAVLTPLPGDSGVRVVTLSISQ